MESRHQIILYAEDDSDDVQMVQECLYPYRDIIYLIHAFNGQDALEKLLLLVRENRAPQLVLLDINMPLLNGKEVLLRIRQSESLRNLPVIIFSTSDNETDKAFARKWGAGYLTKPLSREGMNLLLRKLPLELM